MECTLTGYNAIRPKAIWSGGHIRHLKKNQLEHKVYYKITSFAK